VDRSRSSERQEGPVFHFRQELESFTAKMFRSFSLRRVRILRFHQPVPCFAKYSPTSQSDDPLASGCNPLGTYRRSW
jgi:hypothetical protein